MFSFMKSPTDSVGNYWRFEKGRFDCKFEGRKVSPRHLRPKKDNSI